MTIADGLRAVFRQQRTRVKMNVAFGLVLLGIQLRANYDTSILVITMLVFLTTPSPSDQKMICYNLLIQL